METFARLESEVRSYCRRYPTVFTSAADVRIWDEQGHEFLDFLSGAGALNYGHNHPRLKKRLIEYLEGSGLCHGLDMATTAKREFLKRFQEVILEPRGLRYKVQFTGPTGTNAVEAALKLARRQTGRPLVVCFRNGFHGMTLGALAVTTHPACRAAAGVPLRNVIEMPFDGALGPGRDTLEPLAKLFTQRRGSPELPAAVIVETVQAEGGVNVASNAWLSRLAALTRAHGVLLIVDEIQTGCGRTGTFFSFEPALIEPDLICLSKSLSGYGLPMAVVLLRPQLDVWQPGEHNGTFRGNNLAFVTAAAALDFWQTDELAAAVAASSDRVCRRLREIAARFPAAQAELRGRGLLLGLACGRDGLAAEVARRAFAERLIIETAGPRDEVLKLLPPLVIADEDLTAGLEVIEKCIAAALAAD